MPTHDGVGLDVNQGMSPVGPQAAESDPKYPVQGGQQGALPFSLKRSYLHSQCCVLDDNRLMSAEEQTDESKREQKKDWHISDCFHPSPLRVNRLRADTILANHRASCSSRSTSSPRTTTEPDSAAGLAHRLGVPRQKLNYHLREGFLDLIEERRKGDCMERVVRAVAREFLIAPQIGDRVTADRFSAAYFLLLLRA
jgi:hypothetical protein